MFSDSQQFEEWLATKFWPLMGAEGDDEDDSGDGDDSGDAGDGDSGDSGDGDSGDGSGDGDGDGDTGSAAAEKLRLELEKKDRELKAAQQAAAKAKKEARDAKQKVAKDNGNWEAVATETRAELDDANERAQKAEERAETAEKALDDFQREVRVTRIASRLGFRDPGDAIALLKVDDTGDDKTTERALRILARDKEYLVDQKKASGRSMNGGGGNNGLYSLEELNSLTTEQVMANQEKVNASLAAMGQAGR